MRNAFRKFAVRTAIVGILGSSLIAGVGVSSAYANCPGSLCNATGVSVVAALEGGGTATAAGASAGLGLTATKAAGSASLGFNWASLGGNLLMFIGGTAAQAAMFDDPAYQPVIVGGSAGWSTNPVAAYWGRSFTITDEAVSPSLVDPVTAIDFSATITTTFSTSCSDACEASWLIAIHCPGYSGGNGSGAASDWYTMHTSGYQGGSTFGYTGTTARCPSGFGPPSADRLRIAVQTENGWISTIFTAGDGSGTPETGPVTVTAECKSSSGITTHYFSSPPVSLLNGNEMPIPSANCPAGSVLSRYRIDWFGSEGTIRQILDWTSSPGWVQDLPTTMPNCVPPQSCTLMLYRGSAECLIEGGWNTLCTGWASDPDRASKYSCKYGPYSVPLNQCAVYANFPNGDLRATGDTNGNVNNDALKSPEEEASNDPVAVDSGCSPTWNPISWLTSITCLAKYLLVPSPDALSGLTGTFDDSCTRVPLSLICDGVPWVTATVESANTTPESCNAVTIEAPTGDAVFDPICRAGEFTQTTAGGGVLYMTMRIALWVGCGLFLLHRIAGSFGGKADVA